LPDHWELEVGTGVSLASKAWLRLWRSISNTAAVESHVACGFTIDGWPPGSMAVRMQGEVCGVAVVEESTE
jgi:hypothetical protein